MAANRLSSLNIILLIITLASVLLATYSFIQGGPRTRGNANTDNVSIDTDGGRSDGAAVRDSGRVRPDPRPAPPPRDAGSTDNPQPLPKPRADDGSTGFAPSPQPTPGASNPSDSGNAAINGNVMDAAGKPVSGMTITARRSNFNEVMPYFDGVDAERFRSEMAQYLAAADRETRSTTTGRDGKFKFTGLDANLAYDIRAVSVCSGGATQSHVAAGDTVTLVLSLEGVLRGTVTGADGKPLRKFTITVSANGNNWNQRRQTFNSNDGTFSMTLPFGQRRVQASAPGLASAKFTDVNIDADGAEVAISLETAAVLSGTVTDNGGKALAEATVTIQGANGNKPEEEMVRVRRNNNGRTGEQGFSASVVTDTLGRYRIDSIPPGEYSVTATYGEAKQDQKITLPASETKQDFKLDSGVRVTIKLMDTNGGPLEPDNVWFQQANGGWGQAKRLAITERGLLEYAGLKAGQYTINIMAAGYPQYTRKEVFKEGILNQFEIKLNVGATITGTLVTTSGVSLGQGYQLRLRREGEDEQAAWGQGRTTQLGEDGSFKLGPVETGEWTLEVMNQNWQAVHKEKITVAAGENKLNLNVDTGGTLRVTVTNDDGSAVGWCSISLTGAEGKNYNGWADAKGIVTISFIAAGNYKLTLNTQAGGAQSSDIYIRSGVNEQSLTVKAPNCIRITSVSNDGQGKAIGLQVGDLLFEYNGKKCANMQDIYKFVRETKETDAVSIAIERNGTVMIFNLKGGLIGITGEDAVR